MCAICERPDPSMDDYLQRVRDIVRRNRFAVQGVEGSSCQAEMYYSVGLTALGLPEVVVTGVRQPDGAELVRCWAGYLLEENIVLPGERLQAGPYRMEAVEVDHPHDHLVVAHVLYGDDVRALQLVVADGRGRFPWDEGYRARRPGQPVLGTKAPWFCDEHRPDRIDVPPHL
jgi:hypothetical protein